MLPVLLTLRLPASMADRRGSHSGGEVWTWGMILGDPPTMEGALAALEAGLPEISISNPRGHPEPVYREKPWQLGTLPDDCPG